MMMQLLPPLQCNNTFLYHVIMYYYVYMPSNYAINYYILPSIKCMTLAILKCTFIEFIIYALHIVEVHQEGLQINIHLNYYFIMLEYHANRKVTENYLK